MLRLTLSIGLACACAWVGNAADTEQVEVRVKQTPGGPKLFVDGKRHLPRSVLVASGEMPRPMTTEWQAFDLPFTPMYDKLTTLIHLRFEKKTYYGGIRRPDGWVRFRNMRLTDDAGNVVALGDSFTNKKNFDRMWHVNAAGPAGDMTLEPDGTMRVDVKSPKENSKEWSIHSQGADFHVYTSSMKLKAKTRYHLRFDVKAQQNQPLYPQIYQSPGWLPVPVSPNPFDDTVRLAKERGVDIIIPNGAGATWMKDGTLSFNKVDGYFDRVLAIYPEALVIARFGVNASTQMFKDHPDWRTTFSDGKTVNDDCVSCLPYRDKAAYLVEETAKHLMAKYPRNFAGMHIGAHRCGEWLYEDMLCEKFSGYDVHTLAAWRTYLKNVGWPNAEKETVPTEADRNSHGDNESVFDPAKERKLCHFNRFLNTEMADRIAELAAVARRATQGKKLVAFFFGYSFEVCGWGSESGHYALEYLLEKAAPNIDFLCGPFSYINRKYPDTRPVMAPADTLARYGVMWWNEDDTRTYRETNVDALQIQGKTPMTKPQTLDCLFRNNIQNGERNHGYWWMDLRGRGWFLDRDLWQVMDETKPYETARLMSDKPFAPAVASIVSEESFYCRRRWWRGPSVRPVSVGLRNFERCNVPVGQYLLNDTLSRGIPARYRFYTACWYLSKAQRAALKTQREKRPDLVRVWLWAPGYADETGKSADRIFDATGFKVHKTTDAKVENTTPLFAVETQPGDLVWERYTNGEPALVARPNKRGGWDVFHGFTDLTEERINRILKLK